MLKKNIFFFIRWNLTQEWLSYPERKVERSNSAFGFLLQTSISNCRSSTLGQRSGFDRRWMRLSRITCRRRRSLKRKTIRGSCGSSISSGKYLLNYSSSQLGVQEYVYEFAISENWIWSRRKKIVPGSLLKALVRPGGGESSPVDGDQVLICKDLVRERERVKSSQCLCVFFFLFSQVIYHRTVRTLDGVVVESTKLECGGEADEPFSVEQRVTLSFFQGLME